MDKKIVQQVLGSFGPEYHVFHTSVYVMFMLLTFEDLKTRLIPYEVDLAQNAQQEDDHPVMMAHASSRPRFLGPRTNTVPMG